MSLAATAVALSGAMFSHVALDADAQGRAQLAWSGWRGDRQVARVYDVTTRRTRELQGIHGLRGSVELEDFDVAASGAAVACVRDQRDRDKRGWRVRVFRRTPTGAWSRAITVATTGVYVDDLVCGVGDAGQVSLTWVEGPRSKTLRAAHVGADGAVEPPITIARDPILDPKLEVAADGAATVAFTLGDDDRRLHLAQRPAAGGWTSREIATGGFPELALDGTGRPLMAWTDWPSPDRTVNLAGGPDFTPSVLLREPEIGVSALAAGARGDVLLVWSLSEWQRSGYLRAAVQRPGGAFSPPVLLGRDAGTKQAVLGADGGGAVLFSTGKIDRPRPVLRFLRPDGSWSEQRPAADIAALTPAGPGRYTVATVTFKGTARSNRFTLGVKEIGAS